MGNKKYYRKNYNNNNNNKKNYYFKNKKYNHKDNNYQYDNSHFDVNRIEELVNNNLGDDKINNNEFKEEEFIPKKKDNHDFSLDDIQKDVYKLSKTESLGVDVNTDDLKDEIEVEIKKKPRKNLLIKTSFGYALGIIILLLAIVGTTYSYFNYTRESTQADIVTGDIYVKVVEDTVNLNNKLYPTTKEAARSKTDNVVTFTVKGLNTSDKTIYYEIKLNYGDSKTLIEVGQNNEETYRANAKRFSDIANGARIWIDTIPAGTTEEITKTYKLRMWLSDKVTIDDDNGTYPASTYNTYYASIKASVYGDFQVKEPPLDARGKLAKLAQPDTGIDFGEISSDTNGKGLYKLGNTDILYYRGEVDNNNVIFGGFCWQIVRTTDTGGIKMIYNGVTTGTNDNPTCENTAANDRQLATTSEFNASYTSMSDVGYMYNQRYANSDTKPTTGAYFGSGVTYDDTTNKYTLTGADVTVPDASHHYSCDLTDPAGSCETVRYYYYVSGTSYYHIKLTGGEKIEDAIYKMTGNGSSEVKARAINQNYELNTTNSTIKTAIDTWYQNNLTSYTNYLEDTVYCNDRSFQENGNNTLLKSGWNPNADNTTDNGGLKTHIFFNGRTRWVNSSWYSTTNVPVFTCPKEEDRFTVSSEKGNGKLTYPIGLLTTDEFILAGEAGNSNTSNKTCYLYTRNDYWGLSPSIFSVGKAREFSMNITGSLSSGGSVNTTYGVRPVVSLKPRTEFVDGGEGTKTNPYVVN